MKIQNGTALKNYLFLLSILFILNANFAIAEKIYVNCPSKYKGDDGVYYKGPLWIGEIDLSEQSIIWDGPPGFKLGKKKKMEISDDNYSFSFSCGEIRKRNNCVFNTNVSINRYTGEFSFWYWWDNKDYIIYSGQCQKGKPIPKF